MLKNHNVIIKVKYKVSHIMKKHLSVFEDNRDIRLADNRLELIDSERKNYTRVLEKLQLFLIKIKTEK